MRQEAHPLRRSLQADARLVDGRDQHHEEEVGGAVHRRLADVPHDAVAVRQVPRVPQQHRRVFFGKPGEIEGRGHVEGEEQEEAAGAEEVQPPIARVATRALDSAAVAAPGSAKPSFMGGESLSGRSLWHVSLGWSLLSTPPGRRGPMRLVGGTHEADVAPGRRPGLDPRRRRPRGRGPGTSDVWNVVPSARRGRRPDRPCPEPPRLRSAARGRRVRPQDRPRRVDRPAAPPRGHRRRRTWRRGSRGSGPSDSRAAS